ncbi:MAG: MFS transporter [Actinomycetaceae bacterium]|nr:MFS transporter [Actinomycetaceae bacterium]
METSTVATNDSSQDEEYREIAEKYGDPKRTVALVLIAAIGSYVMMLTLGTMLSARLTAINPAEATGIYSAASSWSAALMLVIIPLFGAFSDRTRSSWGRRRPWIVIGYLVALICFYIIGTNDNYTVIIISFVIGVAFAQAGFNAYAVIPVEGVPNKMRARVMGFMGLCGALAMAAGSYLAAALVPYPLLLMTAPVLIGIVFTLPLLVLYKDPQLPAEELPQGPIYEIFTKLIVNPAKHPNFGWVWLSRFLAGVGMSAFLGFFFLYLAVGLGNGPEKAGQIAGTLSLISAPISIIFFTGSGWLSDKFGSRKPFVALASFLMAIALVIGGFAPNLWIFGIAWCVFAIGQAMYLTVDLALCAEVLPDQADTGKDMAVFGLALNLPNVLVPLLAPTLLGPESKNYMLLWCVAAVACVLGGLIMPLVRGVK